MINQLGEVIQRYTGERSLAHLKEAAAKIRQEYIEKGYINSNFGWIHKDWIKEAIQTGALGAKPQVYPDGYHLFTVKVQVETETVVKGVGRTRYEEEKQKMTFKPFSKWLLFIEWKRGNITFDQYQNDCLKVDGI